MAIGLRLSRVLRAAWPRIDPIGSLLRADARYRERRRMEELTPDALRDIGLTREDIEHLLGR